MRIPIGVPDPKIINELAIRWPLVSICLKAIRPVFFCYDQMAICPLRLILDTDVLLEGHSGKLREELLMELWLFALEDESAFTGLGEVRVP